MMSATKHVQRVWEYTLNNMCKNHVSSCIGFFSTNFSSCSPDPHVYLGEAALVFQREGP